MSYSRRNSIAMEYANRVYWHLFLFAFFIATIFQPGEEGGREVSTILWNLDKFDTCLSID
jgi:hypothetical protein